jgi:hypothetical protein
MEKNASMEQTKGQLDDFMREVRENFQNAGKAKQGWFSSLLKKIFG